MIVNQLLHFITYWFRLPASIYNKWPSSEPFNFPLQSIHDDKELSDYDLVVQALYNLLWVASILFTSQWNDLSFLKIARNCRKYSGWSANLPLKWQSTFLALLVHDTPITVTVSSNASWDIIPSEKSSEASHSGSLTTTASSLKCFRYACNSGVALTFPLMSLQDNTKLRLKRRRQCRDYKI